MRLALSSAARPPGSGQIKRLGTASEQGPIVQVLLPSNAAGDTATGYLRVDPTVFHASSSLRVATVKGVALPSGNRGRTPQAPAAVGRHLSTCTACLVMLSHAQSCLVMHGHA